MISDRSNARIFLSLGLFLSAIVNILIGTVPFITSSVFMFFLFLIFNGWAQGMGWPPAGRTLVFWFSPSERGRWGSVWNLAHNVGAAIAPVLTGFILAKTSQDWHSSFWFQGIICIVIAIGCLIFMKDTPASIGLPSIEKYKNDNVLETQNEGRNIIPMKEIFQKYIIHNKKLNFLAISNIFIYFLRYGVVLWAPVLLTDVKRLSDIGGLAGFSLFELGGILGMISAGWISDLIFKGKKPIVNIIFLTVSFFLILSYFFIPAGPKYQILDYTCLFLIGTFIYGPVMLVGLQAIDMVPKPAAGSAAGYTGLFGYIFGTIPATLGIGAVADHFGWNSVFVLLLISCVFGIIFSKLSDK
jgi:OPA family glycerol-3-phosphate transporter-like MFS transporter